MTTIGMFIKQIYIFTYLNKLIPTFVILYFENLVTTAYIDFFLQSDFKTYSLTTIGSKINQALEIIRVKKLISNAVL